MITTSQKVWLDLLDQLLESRGAHGAYLVLYMLIKLMFVIIEN